MSSLLTLTVKNFVLIEHAEVEFADGLTILTGQTGAGKSLFLRALNFLLGAKLTAQDVIATAGKKAIVEAIFSVDSPILQKTIENLGLADDWDGEELVLQRTMDANGRSRARINNRATTLANLRALTSQLVSILSQHEYQRLVRPELQTRVLDGYANLLDKVSSFESLRLETARQATELKELRDNQEEQKQFVERAQEDYQLCKELDPKENEFTELSEEIEKLRRAEDTRNKMVSAITTLSENDECVTTTISRLQRRLTDLTDLYPTVGQAYDAMERALDELGDAVHCLSRAEQTINDDPRLLQQYESRVAHYRDIGRRLRIPPEELHLEYSKLADIVVDNHSEKISKLELKLQANLHRLADADDELTVERTKFAPDLCDAVESSLHELGMEKAKFFVELSKPKPRKDRTNLFKPAIPGPGGSSQVQFIFAANPGEQPRPVAEVASGGELSRIMLALQQHLGRILDVSMLVFDEIDQNVGGRLGPVIGKHLSALATERQVFVISHLPQVAAFADKHIMARKNSTDDKTRTEFWSLVGEELIHELAAMTRGDAITDIALDEARELRAAAQQAKQAPVL